MKILPRVLFASLLGVVTSFAGGFGGPPPFQNGSPLQTGTDGTYQATLSATNFTGLINFAYSGGSQTSIPSQNQWVAFLNGSIFRGSLETSMNGSDITGILDSESLALPRGSDGTLTLPIIFVVQGSRASGKFFANIDFNSPNGNFSGKGTLQGSSAEVINFIAISQESSTSATGAHYSGPIEVTNISTSLPEGTTPFVTFKVRGSRTSTTAGGGFATTSTNSN